MFSQKQKVILVAAHVALAGLLYGLDTGSIGPITEMAQFTDSIGLLSSTQQGIYVASILLSASASAFASGHVSDAISRRFGIMTGALLTMLGTIISAASPNFASLIVARLITGAGAGQAISVASVYLIEMAQREVRGVTACLVQFYIATGVAFGYFIAYGSRTLAGSIAWRLPFIIEACIAAYLAVGMLFMPFSPRWLVEHDRIDEARFVLTRFRLPEQVEPELHDICESRATASQHTTGFLEPFRKRYLYRTLLGISLMGLQQLTGIDAVLYYAPIVFQQAGFASSQASFLASGVSGLLMLAATVPAQIWVDRWGRRPPLIIGGLAMVCCFIVIGSMYARFGIVLDGAVHLTSRAAQWTVVVFVYLFAINYCWSWAVLVRIYAIEIIPTRLRARVAAMEQLSNWSVNFVVALTAPLFLRSSPSGPYFLYGAATAVGVVVCWCMPETKGKSLEEIEGIFEKVRQVESVQELGVAHGRATPAPVI